LQEYWLVTDFGVLMVAAKPAGPPPDAAAAMPGASSVNAAIVQAASPTARRTSSPVRDMNQASFHQGFPTGAFGRVEALFIA
jgi:hypothetical protein